MSILMPNSHEIASVSERKLPYLTTVIRNAPSSRAICEVPCLDLSVLETNCGAMVGQRHDRPPIGDKISRRLTAQHLPSRREVQDPEPLVAFFKEQKAC